MDLRNEEPAQGGANQPYPSLPKSSTKKLNRTTPAASRESIGVNPANIFRSASAPSPARARRPIGHPRLANGQASAAAAANATQARETRAARAARNLQNKHTAGSLSAAIPSAGNGISYASPLNTSLPYTTHAPHTQTGWAWGQPQEKNPSL